MVISEDIYIPEEVYDFVVVIPNALKSIVSIMSVIPLQMISYEVAKLRGCSIDKPRNLAKSVTVE